MESPALDPAVFDLASLRYLNLARNKFQGSEIPTLGFERLTELTHLNLSTCEFAGGIPHAIKRLTNLVSLDLSSEYYLYDQDDSYLSTAVWSAWSLVEPNLGSLVAHLHNLEQLYLGKIDLSGNAPNWCNAFTNSTTPRLQVLSLPNCWLSGPICASVSGIRPLTEINLQFNKINGPVELFADLPSLSVLTLTNNLLEGRFPAKLFQNNNLTDIDISYNFDVSGSLPNFSSQSMLTKLLVSSTDFSGIIPSSIANLKSLNMLGLASSDFPQELPSSIGQLTSLKKLEVSGSGIIGSIPPWIANLTSLIWLQFSDCSLTGQIPSFVGNIKNLTRLQLYNCDFSGPIPPHIYNLTQLQFLYLHSNNFVGSIQLSPFWKLPHLISLELSNNKLSVIEGDDNYSATSINHLNVRTLGLASCNLSSIPNAMRNMPRISNLDISRNQIRGAIPHWAWETWSSMLILDLSHNKFTSVGYENLPVDVVFLDLSFNLLQGPIPVPTPAASSLDFSNNRFSSIPLSFGFQLSRMRYLQASRNNISGKIPPSICDASSLVLLDLSYNNLSGSIPSCLLEDINSLAVLNFKANQLRGKLPHDIMQGCASEEMDFSDNQIEGQVPRSLLACRDLQVFDIGNNQITDNFPCWMSMLPKLQVLVLKSNKFFGEMGTPVLGKESNCEFTKLRVIDLASNNFSGTLQSKWFRSLQSMARKSSNDVVSMQYQHVTDGTRYQFNTAITYKGSEVVFSRILETLVVIDVSNNAFHGVIPKSIGELLLLCGINMSHNAFTGQIPAQFGALHQLESLDLSSNDLSGEIPQELAWLDFLSVLNLSYNGLVGNIPESPHFQTFNNLSFLGNIGLCGLPLSKECEKTNPNMVSHSLKKKSVDIILFLFVGLGFGVGFAVSVVVSVTWGSTIAKHLEMALPRGVVKYLLCRLV